MQIPFNLSIATATSSLASIPVTVVWPFAAVGDLTAYAVRNSDGAQLPAVIESAVAGTVTVTNPYGAAVSVKVYVERREKPIQTYDPTPGAVDARSLNAQLNGLARPLQDCFVYLFGNSAEATAARVIHSIDAFTIPTKLARAEKFIRFDENGDFTLATGLLDPLQQAFLDELDDYDVEALVNVQPDWTEADTGSWAYIKNRPATFPSDWNTMANIPTEFPVESHTHVQADITDTAASNVVFLSVRGIDEILAGSSGRVRLVPSTVTDTDDTVTFYTGNDVGGSTARWSINGNILHPSFTSIGEFGTPTLRVNIAHINTVRAWTDLRLGNTGFAKLSSTETAGGVPDDTIIMDLSNFAGGASIPRWQWTRDGFFPVTDGLQSCGAPGNRFLSTHAVVANVDDFISMGFSNNIRIETTTSIGGTDADDAITIRLNDSATATDHYYLSTTVFSPVGNKTKALGGSSERWGNFWGSTIDCDGNIVTLAAVNSATLTTTGIATFGGAVTANGALLSPGSGGAGSFRAGLDAVASGANSTAVGPYSSATDGSANAFGRNSSASASGASALGTYANASHLNSTAIGRDATTTKANQVMLGSAAAVATCPDDIEVLGELTQHKRRVISHSSGTLNLTAADYGSIILVSGSAGAINLPAPVLGAGFLIKTTGATSIPLTTASGNIVIDGTSSPGWLAEDAYSWIDIVGSSGTVWQELRRGGAWEVEV